MKKHNILKVVLISIVVLFLCTWIFPGATFSTELTVGERSQMGIFDLISYSTLTLTYFGYVLVYTLLVGGFYGVANKIPAYRKLLDKIVKRFNKSEGLLLSILTAVIAIIVSVTGLTVGILILFPFVISLVLLMGYNKLVAASVTVGGATVGLIGTTLGVQTISMFNSSLSTTDVTLSITTQIIAKIAILVIATAILIFNILKYAKTVKNKIDAEEASFIPEKVKALGAKKVKIWPFVTVASLFMVILIVAFLPWSEALFGKTIMTDALAAVQGFAIADFAIFSKILGTVSAFGSWYVSGEILAVLLIATIILGACYKIKFNDFVDAFIAGLKKAVYPATLMLLVYTCLIIVTFNPFQLFFADLLLGLTKGFNVVTMTLVAFLASVFNVEAAYAGQSTLPYLVTVITDTKLYSVIAVIFQAMYGLAMLVVPTSVLLIGTLSYLNISYGQWLKHIWKVFVQLLVVLLIIFLILLVI